MSFLPLNDVCFTMGFAGFGGGEGGIFMIICTSGAIGWDVRFKGLKCWWAKDFLYMQRNACTQSYCVKNVWISWIICHVDMPIVELSTRWEVATWSDISFCVTGSCILMLYGLMNILLVFWVNLLITSHLLHVDPQVDHMVNMVWIWWSMTWLHEELFYCSYMTLKKLNSNTVIKIEEKRK